MTKQQLEKQLIKLGVKGSLSKALHLIDEYVAGMIPEKVDETEAKFENDPDNRLGEGYSIGYNQAIDEISRRAGIGENNA